MDDKVISARGPKPVGAYPHARRAGNLLFLSGLGPRRPGTDEIPQGIEAQCRSVFDNVRAVLEDAGSSWDHIVDVTVFLTDMKHDFPAYNRLWEEYFAGHAPARTTVEVRSLPTPIAIELKVVATID